MLGLPKSTELNKQLPKKSIYAKFNMNTAAKDKFDADIAKIAIVNEISPQTIKAITPSDDVTSFYVLQVSLKRKNFNEHTISQLSKLINQNMLFILEHNDECKLAIYHTRLIQNAWQKTSDCSIQLKGLNMSELWQNVVTQIGSIEIDDGNTLEQQILKDERQTKLAIEIEKLEKQARKETQPKKKFEIVQQIAKLKNKMEK